MKMKFLSLASTQIGKTRGGTLTFLCLWVRESQHGGRSEASGMTESQA